MQKRALLLGCLLVTACADVDSGGEDGSPRNPVGPVERSANVTERPVRIGFDGPRFDACAGYGVVANLNPTGENYLPVRAAPAGSASETDRLEAGRGVAMCQKVGDWFGIVYAPESEEPVDCGTGSPVASVRRYEGPCRSGWVNENYIKLVAG